MKVYLIIDKLHLLLEVGLLSVKVFSDFGTDVVGILQHVFTPLQV